MIPSRFFAASHLGGESNYSRDSNVNPPLIVPSPQRNLKGTGPRGEGAKTPCEIYRKAAAAALVLLGPESRGQPGCAARLTARLDSIGIRGPNEAPLPRWLWGVGMAATAAMPPIRAALLAFADHRVRPTALLLPLCFRTIGPKPLY